MIQEAERIWIGDNITIEFPEGVVGLIRCLSIPGKSPGPTEWACAIVLNTDGTCVMKILNGTRCPKLKEINQIKKHFIAQGYTGTWHRYKPNKPHKTVTIK